MTAAPQATPTRTGPGRQGMDYTIAYCVIFIALGMTIASLGPTLPGLARHTNSSMGQISILFSARALGFLLTALTAARLYDRIPGHRILILALILMAAATMLVPVIPWLPLLAIVWGLIGVGQGFLNVGANTLMTWVHGPKVGPHLNALHFTSGIGAVVAPIIIAQLVLLSGDINWAYWALGLLILPLILVLVRLPSPPIERAVEETDRKQTKRKLVVFLFALLLFLDCGAEISFSGWVYSYATTQGLGGPALAAYLTSAFWGGYTISRLIWIFLSKSVRARDILIWNFLACGLCLLLVLLWPGSRLALWVGTFGAGFALGPIFANALVWARQHMTISGKTMGLFFVGVALGSMSVPWVIGQLFDAIGPQAVMITLLVDLALALVVVALLASGPWSRKNTAVIA